MPTSTFARIGTIQGESIDARHPHEIEVVAWSWGLSQSVTSNPGGGSGVGKAHLQDFSFTHHLDKASPLLMRACATGEHVADATITARKAGKGQQEYLVITMTDVLVTSVATSAGGDGDATLESVTLAFAKVDLEYKPQKADGSLDAAVQFAYDVQANKAL